MNQNNQNVFNIKKLIIETASKIISEQLDPIEGCRILVNLESQLPNSKDEDFLTIVGIESETDVFPIGKQRELWNIERLAQYDREKEKYINKIKELLFEACKNLIKKNL